MVSPGQQVTAGPSFQATAPGQAVSAQFPPYTGPMATEKFSSQPQMSAYDRMYGPGRATSIDYPVTNYEDLEPAYGQYGRHPYGIPMGYGHEEFNPQTGEYMVDRDSWDYYNEQQRLASSRWPRVPPTRAFGFGEYEIGARVYQGPPSALPRMEEPPEVPRDQSLLRTMQRSTAPMIEGPMPLAYGMPPSAVQRRGMRQETGPSAPSGYLSQVQGPRMQRMEEVQSIRQMPSERPPSQYRQEQRMPAGMGMGQPQYNPSVTTSYRPRGDARSEWTPSRYSLYDLGRGGRSTSSRGGGRLKGSPENYGYQPQSATEAPYEQARKEIESSGKVQSGKPPSQYGLGSRRM